MSLIDDIKADREAGTPGPWGADVDGFGGNRLYALGFDSYDGARIFAQFRNTNKISWDQAKANTRRASRVPQMEAALLAADALADAAESLVALTDNTSPFGGEMQCDRIERTHDEFTKALAAYREATR